MSQIENGDGEGATPRRLRLAFRRAGSPGGRPVVAAACLAACLLLVVALAPPAGATTEPAATFFSHVTLTDTKIEMTRRKVSVGSLVVFTVRNASSRSRRIVVGSYKSGVLAPGKQIEFELSFPVPWIFAIRSSGSHLPTLKAKFVCSF